MKLELGKRYPVKILKVIRAGVIVQVGEFRPDDTAFIHLSKISKKFVDDPSKFVTVGRTYEAEAVKGSVNDVELSLLHMNLEPMMIHVDLAKGPDRTSFRPYVKQPNKPPVPISNPVTLDDMITKMNKDYNDKTQAMNARSRRKTKR